MTSTRRLFLLAACASILASCRPPLPVLGELPDFNLIAVSTGRPAASLKRADLAGRVWVADFIFTHCAGPCPAITNTMMRLQKELPATVGLLTFTVDPDRDDAKTLSDYAARFRAEPDRWLFVTGPKKPLLDFLVKGFKLPAVEDPRAPSGRRVTHSTRLVLVDRQARLRGYFDSEDAAGLEALKKALRSLN